MEPLMNVMISVDEASLGAVVQDISSARGGHVTSLDDDAKNSSTNNNIDLPPIDLTKIYAPQDPFGSSTLSSGDENSGLGNRPRSIAARVPLKEMVGYMKHLRGLTGGRGTFVMSVDRFERMGSMREKVVLAEMRGMQV